MLFRIHTLTFAVAAVICASTIGAQPEAPPTADQVRELISKAATTKKCDDCTAAIKVSRGYARANATAAVELSKRLCPSITKYPVDVCNGYLDMQVPVMIKATQSAYFKEDDDKFICHSMFGMCPSPAITANPLRFPRPKPKFPIKPVHSGKLVNVVHLSDWHVDELYEPGAEAACDKPICCRTFPTTNTTAPIRRKAATWGDYRCDTPIKLTQDLMKFIRKEIPNIDFAILTGDVPPHDTWLETKETVTPILEHSYALIESFLGKNTNLYPTIGNHDAGPT
ncbi:hypothetical protein BGZ88_001177, partial [Linnemannia elongata]